MERSGGGVQILFEEECENFEVGASISDTWINNSTIDYDEMLLQSKRQQMSNLMICDFFHANFSEYAFIYVLNSLNGTVLIVSILHFE